MRKKVATNRFALECHGLSKRFAGLEAVKNVTLQIAPGERRGIIGPNGAGKTTLFRLISGEFPVTSGTVRLFDQDVTRVPCHRRTHMGLGRTFQITNLFPTMTILDNLVVAAMGQRGMKFSMLRPLSTYRDLYQQAEQVLENVGMTERRGTSRTCPMVSSGRSKSLWRSFPTRRCFCWTSRQPGSLRLNRP
jgi:branched-chain amino acid transport system ATP-binding protein